MKKSLYKTTYSERVTDSFLLQKFLQICHKLFPLLTSLLAQTEAYLPFQNVFYLSNLNDSIYDFSMIYVTLPVASYLGNFLIIIYIKMGLLVAFLIFGYLKRQTCPNFSKFIHLFEHIQVIDKLLRLVMDGLEVEPVTRKKTKKDIYCKYKILVIF